MQYYQVSHKGTGIFVGVILSEPRKYKKDAKELFNIQDIHSIEFKPVECSLEQCRKPACHIGINGGYCCTDHLDWFSLQTNQDRLEFLYLEICNLKKGKAK